MDIKPETVHILLNAARDKEIKDLENQNRELRELIEKTKKALKYFPTVKDFNGQGTSTRRFGESKEAHLRSGKDPIGDKGLPEGEQEPNKD